MKKEKEKKHERTVELDREKPGQYWKEKFENFLDQKKPHTRLHYQKGNTATSFRGRDNEKKKEMIKWNLRQWTRITDCHWVMVQGSNNAQRSKNTLRPLRWLGTVLDGTEFANFFVKTYCLWHKYLENEKNIRGSPCSNFQKMGPNIAIFDLVKYGVNEKTVTCLPLGSNFDNF